MKQKISITLDDKLMKFIDKERGDVSRSRFIERYIAERVGIYEALWIFSEEVSKVTKLEWISAHTSQPVGKPLHKHRGFIVIDEEALTFYDEEMNLQVSVKKDHIRDLSVKYDDTFRRFAKSRGWIPPLQFKFDGEKVYLFTRSLGKTIYAGDNRYFLSNLGIEPDVEKEDVSLSKQ